MHCSHILSKSSPSHPHAENLGCIKNVTTMIPNGYHENVACHVVNKLVIIWQKESNYKTVWQQERVYRYCRTPEDNEPVLCLPCGAQHHLVSNQFKISPPTSSCEKQVIFQALQELRADDMPSTKMVCNQLTFQLPKA